MTEELPIVIRPHNELIDRYTKIKSVCNKLEAQFNFQTLTAGWYGDEDNILSIHLYLETPEGFDHQRTQTHQGTLHTFADDVFNYFNESDLHITCIIAITDAELNLLSEQEKILASYIQAKLLKVLNLIAKQQKLFPL
ncbi:hypothetical protein AAD001_04445 [Colwelliaceae bacterium 6471]